MKSMNKGEQNPKPGLSVYNKATGFEQWSSKM